MSHVSWLYSISLPQYKGEPWKDRPNQSNPYALALICDVRDPAVSFGLSWRFWVDLRISLSFFSLQKGFRGSSQCGIGFYFFFNLNNFIRVGKCSSTQFHVQVFHFPLRILRSHWNLNWRSRLRYVSGHFKIKLKYSDEYLAKDHLVC